MSGGYNRFGGEIPEEEEGRLVTNEGRKYHQFQAAIIAALAATAAGTSDGWLLTAVTKYKEHEFNRKDFLIFSHIMNFAAFMGAMIAGYLVDKIGRRQTLILAGSMVLPTWILYVVSHKILISLSIGTALGGFASGLVSVAVPLYISEISETSIRGTLGVFFYLQFIAGELFTTFEDPENMSMNAVAVNCILVATIFLVTFIWVPESPFSLMSKGEENEAKISIKFFRGSNYHSEDEVEHLKQSVSKRMNLKESLKEENTINALVICLLLMFMSRLVALDGFNLRLYKIFFHLNDNFRGKATTLFLLVQLAGIGGAALLIERWGRRSLLIISSSLLAVIVFMFLITDLLVHIHTIVVPAFFVYIYTFVYSFGVGPVPWVLMTELVPLHHKALSCTSAASFFWFMAFTSSMRFNLIIDHLSQLMGFLMFFILCTLITIISVYLVPETKGRNPEVLAIPNVKKFIFRNTFMNNNNVNAV